MKTRAYPKVNLCLKVYKGFVDGKHRIDSVMFLYKRLFDEITIRKAADLYILYKDAGKEISISDCLVSKALKYLENKYGIDINYHILIVKHIPFASGMGGGSADAAAVINYVIAQQENPVVLDLKEIALELGSDIPFFLSRYNIARVKDIGQYVTPIYN
ncbi:MAG: hypothetical protein MJ219_01405 [Mycoplasmoidaceae bacterium]|nr:hypothetical protein [Mycoplasmoidaceae bacterium]